MTTQAQSPNSTPTDSSRGFAEDAQATAQDAAAKVQDQAQAAMEQAQAAVSQTQDRVRQQIDLRSTQAGEQISTQAADLRSVGDALREKGQDGPAQMADRLAGYAEQAGSYLSEKDVDTILSDAEDLGRRRPGAVAAGALALGFAASRFLKASSSRRYSVIGQPRLRSDGGAGLPNQDAAVEPIDIEPATIVPSDTVPGTHPIEPLPGPASAETVPGTMNEGI